MGARGTRLPGRSGLIRPGGEAIAWLVCTVSCEPAINSEDDAGERQN